MLTQLSPPLTAVTKSVQSASRFMKEHYSICSTWNNHELEQFLQWHANRGLLGIYRYHGRIEAVATARVIQEESDQYDDYFHDPDGDIVYCSHFVSLNKRATLSILQLLLQKFYQTRIAFCRKTRMYHEHNMIEFVKKFRGQIYGR